MAQLIEKHSRSDSPAWILVYDSVILWAQDVADRMGLDAAPFFTQSCAVSAISYHENHGTFKLPLEGSMISIPSLPPLDTDHDLPSLVKDMDSYPAIMKINLNQFSAFHKVKCVFFNTYHKLEHEEPFTSSYQYVHKKVVFFFLSYSDPYHIKFQLSVFCLAPPSLD